MLAALCCALFTVFPVNHSEQVRCGIFDVEMFVLARPAFRAQHSAAVNVLKVTVREFKSSLGILVLLHVDPQIPFGVLPEAMRGKKLILSFRRGPVLAPVIPLVEYETPGPNQVLGKVERCRV